MPTLSKYKNSLIAIVAACVLYLGYIFLWPQGSDLPLLAAEGEKSQVDTELLALLARTKQIQLDTSLFQDPVFNSLQDFGQIIPAQPLGRENPFAPIPGIGVQRR